MAASNPMGYNTPHAMAAAHMTSMPHPISQGQPGMMSMMGHGPSQGMPMPGQGMQGMPGQGMPGQGMPGQGMPGQGMPGQGMPGQGMPGQGMPGQGMPGQGMPGQGMPGQGMPNFSQGMPMQPMQGQPMQAYNQGMPGMGGQGMPHAMAQPPQHKEVNTVELCRVGQETTQEIANKTTEVFQMLKTLQLPNNVNVRIQDFQDRKAKTEDCMKNLALSFHKLRVIYNRVEQDTAGMPEEASEDLLPVETKDGNITGKLPHVTETYKFVSEEHQELVEQLHQKNQQIKEIIDHIRTIIWEINTMFAMRKI